MADNGKPDLVSTLECAIEEIEMNMVLYNAVDALFHAPDGAGYPVGHFNEDKIDRLREMFLYVSDAANYNFKNVTAADLLHHELMKLIGEKDAA